MDICFSWSSLIWLCWGTVLASIGGIWFGLCGRCLNLCFGGG